MALTSGLRPGATPAAASDPNCATATGGQTSERGGNDPRPSSDTSEGRN